MQLIRFKQGFTLLEVVLGMAVLGLVVLSIINFTGSSFIATTHSGQISRAVALAQEKMEELRACYYSEFSAPGAVMGGGPFTPPAGDAPFSAISGREDLQCSSVITGTVLELDGYPVSGLSLEVVITRGEGNQVVRLMSFVH